MDILNYRGFIITVLNCTCKLQCTMSVHVLVILYIKVIRQNFIFPWECTILIIWGLLHRKYCRLGKYLSSLGNHEFAIFWITNSITVYYSVLHHNIGMIHYNMWRSILTLRIMTWIRTRCCHKTIISRVSLSLDMLSVALM